MFGDDNGGLGGLGGYLSGVVQNPLFLAGLQMLGNNSPRIGQLPNTMEGVPATLMTAAAAQNKQRELARERALESQKTEAMVQALKDSGYDEADARRYAINPNAINIVQQYRSSQKQEAADKEAAARLNNDYDTPQPQPVPPVPPVPQRQSELQDDTLQKSLADTASKFDDFALSIANGGNFKTVGQVAQDMPNQTQAAQFLYAANKAGLSPDTQLTREALTNPITGTALARGAGLGAGLSDEQLQEAQARAAETSRARQAARQAEQQQPAAPPQMQNAGPYAASEPRPQMQNAGPYAADSPQPSLQLLAGGTAQQPTQGTLSNPQIWQQAIQRQQQWQQEQAPRPQPQQQAPQPQQPQQQAPQPQQQQAPQPQQQQAPQQRPQQPAAQSSPEMPSDQQPAPTATQQALENFVANHEAKLQKQLRDAYSVLQNSRVSPGMKKAAELRIQNLQKELEATSDIKDYRYSSAQDRAAGEPVESYKQFIRENKRAGAMRTDINTVEGFDTFQKKEILKRQGAALEKIQEAADNGNKALPAVNEIIRLAKDTPGGYAGKMSPTAAKALSALGVTVPEGLRNAELMNSLQRQLIPALRQPGAVSNYEDQTYLDAAPGLPQSKAGREAIAEMFKAQIQRNNEYAATYEKYLGRPELREKLLEVSNKPLFDDKTRERLDALLQKPAQRAPASSRKTGGTTSSGIGWSLD